MNYYSCAAMDPYWFPRNYAFYVVPESQCVRLYVSDSSLGEKTEETYIPMIPIPIGIVIKIQ